MDLGGLRYKSVPKYFGLHGMRWVWCSNGKKVVGNCYLFQGLGDDCEQCKTVTLDVKGATAKKEEQQNQIIGKEHETT